MQLFQRVLLIDDDQVNNYLSTYVIKKRHQASDIEIISFTDPEKGFQHIASSNLYDDVPTVLLLDINMPVLTGWDILDKMKELSENTLKHLTIYMLSSSVDIFDIKRAEANPLIKGFISKPLAANIGRIFT